MSTDVNDDELLSVPLLVCARVNNDVREADEAPIRQIKRLSRSRPKKKVRPTWNSFMRRVSPVRFRRMFRMSVATFEKLCDDASNRMTEEMFRPEAFLLHGGMSDQPTSWPLQHQGGHVPGEAKAAASL